MMTEQVMSGLVMTMGLLAAGIGVVTSAHRVRMAGRAHRRLSALQSAVPEGWASWFWGGFSGLAVGTQWCWATVALTGWMIAGLLLIGLGFQLLGR